MRYSLGLIGHPVSHSLSPRLHKAALAYHALDGDYQLFDIAPADLENRFLEFIEQDFKGLNVTIPHKQAVLSLLHSLDDNARSIGAVNTIRFDDGILSGNNTDVFGFTQALKDIFARNELRGANAVVVGAGGAARACLLGMAELGLSKVFIYARHPEKANQLLESLQFAHQEPFLAMNISVLTSLDKEAIASCSLLVNATPLGQSDPSLPDWYCHLLSLLRANAFVYDLVYAIGKDTPTVLKARSLGLKASDGTAMLLYQAAQSFKIWTGLDVPLTCLMAALN